VRRELRQLVDGEKEMRGRAKRARQGKRQARGTGR
jgi:hypothetical protein